MPRFHPLTTSFNTGEISPRLSARTDFVKYPSSFETMENLIPLAEGLCLRRSGSRHIGEVYDSTAMGRLKRFEFSTEQAYIIEVGDFLFRFYKDQQTILVDTTDASVTNGLFATDITGWTNIPEFTVTNTDISFTANNTITSGSSEFGSFATGDTITVSGSTSNDGTYTVATASASTITTNETTITTEAAGDTVTVSKIGIFWNSGQYMDIIANGQGDQAITISAGNTGNTHVLEFEVIGAPGDELTFGVGTTSGTSDILSFKAKTGYHSASFTPGATTFYINWKNNGTKTVGVSTIAFQSNQAVSITTPYAISKAFEIDGPQSADVLYIFHETVAPYKLERRGHRFWSLVEVAWQDGPWGALNETATTLTPSAATGNGITLTASAITGINGDTGFQSTDVGRLVRLDNPASGVNWGWGIIVGYTSTTVVTVDVKRDFDTTNADTRWRLGSWSATTGYPKAGQFFEQRLFAAGTTDDPQTFWGSQTSDFENMAPDSDDGAATPKWDGTVQDDDALDYTLVADDVNAILWMKSNQDSMVIGTAGGEWVPSSSGAVLTPTDLNAKRQTTHGSSDQSMPVAVNDTVLFVQKARRKLREFAFNFESDGFRAFDMTRLAQHISFGGIGQMAFAEEPNSILWAIRNDGQLLSMTYRRDEDSVGWARHIMGGSFSGGDPVVESVETIPGTNGSGQVNDSTDRDEVWLIVKRTINGATKRYIEVLERDHETGYVGEDAYYLDSLITYDSTATTTITGLSHLEGETVGIWADGAIQADKVVASGQITLDSSASVVQVGLRYRHRLKTLRIEGGNPAGTSIGKRKQIYGLTFVLLNTHTLRYGRDDSNMVKLDFRQVSDNMDMGVPLFTGEKYVSFEDRWSSDSRVIVDDDDPTPFGLLAMAPEVVVNALK